MKQKKNGKDYLWIFLSVVGVILIVVALRNILPYYMDRFDSEKTYDKLRTEYIDVQEEHHGEKKKDWWLTDVFVHFEELRRQNENIVAWIRFDDTKATGIDYPVLYSGDNEKYLRRNLYGKYHTAGSIFLEGLNNPDFKDYYSILYGHNMQDGSMFGNLDKYRDQVFWEKNRYFTLYTEKTVYRFRIFACQEAVNGGYVYKIGYRPGEEYQTLLDHMTEDSLIKTDIRPDSRQKTVTLSTCTGNGYSKRFCIHAVCVDMQNNRKRNEDG